MGCLVSASIALAVSSMPDGAEAALHGAGIHERALERMERLAVGQTLDRQNGAPVGLDRQIRAGAHGEAVDQHRAGAAHLGVAGSLGPLQVEPVAQHVQQQGVRRHLELERSAIDEHVNRHATARHATTAWANRATGSAPRARAAAIRSARRTNTATIARL